jgi:anti-sigma factor RsiW
MEKIPRLTPDQRSNLVAYLDGELPEAEAKGIEQVLVKSPSVQHDVEMLSRTWELLDQLPRLEGTEELVSRTLSAARADEAPRGLLPQSLVDRLPKEPFRKGAIVVIWAAGLALSAVAGFAITNRLVPDDSQDLLRNLPVIQKLDLYSNVGSIEFLKELQKRVGSFDEPKKTEP